MRNPYNHTTDRHSRTKCVPAYERAKHLYTLGKTFPQIADVLNQEMGDIDLTHHTTESVSRMIRDNQQEFDEYKYELGAMCREEIQMQTKRLFNVVQNKEFDMVDVFSEKMGEALEELRDLDLDEQDELGNYKNTSRVFVLTEMIIKLQSSVSKIVGTDALREVEIFRQKANAKQEAEANSKANLLPAHPKNSVELPASQSVWI